MRWLKNSVNERPDYVVTDINSRQKKAEKIIAILNKYCNSLIGKRILDIGCGAGIIANELAKFGTEVVAVDITNQYMYSDIVNTVNFQIVDSQQLPYKSNTFDIVICNHILEHVPSKIKVLSEIQRVLKRNGLGYIANGNKLWPIEPHYKLPFLSWLPPSLSNRYVRIRGIDSYDDISLPTYWELEYLLDNIFEEVNNVTELVIKNPIKYNADDVASPVINKLIPNSMLSVTIPYLPGWIYVVKK